MRSRAAREFAERMRWWEEAPTVTINSAVSKVKKEISGEPLKILPAVDVLLVRLQSIRNCAATHRRENA
jgi:hypothetical protein